MDSQRAGQEGDARYIATTSQSACIEADGRTNADGRRNLPGTPLGEEHGTGVAGASQLSTGEALVIDKEGVTSAASASRAIPKKIGESADVTLDVCSRGHLSGWACPE